MRGAAKLQAVPVNEDPNPRAAIGANNPPPDRPYEAVKAHIDDLMVEARNWCDGAAVENQAQADEVSRLIDEMRKAQQAADDARKLENKPFDDGKAEVQARYNLLIGDTKNQRGVTVLALEALKAAIGPFLRKLDEEKRAAAAKAQAEADEKARAAAEALRAAHAGSDLESREAAEALITDARRAQFAASRAANDRAAGRGGDRTVSLRSVFSPVMTDAKAALKHYAATNPEALKGFLLSLAQTDVRMGKRQIPGFTVNEEKVPV